MVATLHKTCTWVPEPSDVGENENCNPMSKCLARLPTDNSLKQLKCDTRFLTERLVILNASTITSVCEDCLKSIIQQLMN